MAANKKHFVQETIELSNGDQITAKNLPIKKLKLFHKEMRRWSDHMQDTRDELKALEVEAADLEKESEESYEDILERLQRKYEHDTRDSLTFIDVAASCALIALSTWHVRNEKGATIDNEKIDLDYIEEHVDMISLNRIIEIAGAMEVGDVSGEGKA